MLGHAVTRLAYNACRVALVNHYHCVVLLGKFINLVKRAYIAVHREHTVGSDDAEALCLSCYQLLLQVIHVAVLITVAHRLAQTHAVDDGRVVQRIGDDGILFRQQRFEKTTVGVKTSGIEDGVFGAEEIGDDAFQLLVRVLRAADKPHRSHAVTAFVHAVFGGLNKFRVVRQTQVVVRAEVYHILTALYLNARRLRSDDYAFVLIESCILDFLQGRLQVFLKLFVHNTGYSGFSGYSGVIFR